LSLYGICTDEIFKELTKYSWTVYLTTIAEVIEAGFFADPGSEVTDKAAQLIQ